MITKYDRLHLFTKCSKSYYKMRQVINYKVGHLSFVADNKEFWKVMKPLLNEKGSGVSNEVV